MAKIKNEKPSLDWEFLIGLIIMAIMGLGLLFFAWYSISKNIEIRKEDLKFEVMKWKHENGISD